MVLSASVTGEKSLDNARGAGRAEPEAPDIIRLICCLWADFFVELTECECTDFFAGVDDARNTKEEEVLVLLC